jgi:hypothetical protein
MTVHYLKIDQRWFDRIVNNEKTAEVRLDDRDFQTGDRINFRVEPETYQREVRTITHVLREVPGLASGYVILSLGDPRVDDLRKARDRAIEANVKLGRSNRGLRGHIARLNRMATD